jgi:hypothetical protein
MTMTREERNRFKISSPSDLRSPLSHDDLIALLGDNPETTVADWIRDELHRRHLGRLADEIEKLIAATERLVGETKNVHKEVASLAIV